MLEIAELEPVHIKEIKHLKLVVDNTKAIGGKEPPGDTWLERLNENAVFLVREKNSQNFILAQFGLLEKMGAYSRIVPYIKPIDPEGLLVDNTRFCNRFELMEYYDNDDDSGTEGDQQGEESTVASDERLKGDN